MISELLVIVGEYEREQICQPVCATTTGRHHGLESLTVSLVYALRSIRE